MMCSSSNLSPSNEIPFQNSKVLSVGSAPVTWVQFELDGQHFHGMNAGPRYKFSEAISFYIDCADQAEIDYYWTRLLEGGGTEMSCGWLKDRFGLCWQVVPRIFNTLLNDSNPAKAQAAMNAMLEMTKFDIAKLQSAHSAAS